MLRPVVHGKTQRFEMVCACQSLEESRNLRCFVYKSLGVSSILRTSADKILGKAGIPKWIVGENPGVGHVSFAPQA